ncbi:hypothetical protein R6Q59_005543 [Mikania micrantha]
MEEIANGVSESSPMQKKECFFFVQYGMCSFGKNCRYNHPPIHKDSSVVQNGRTENLHANYKKKRPCKFFRAGFCKYGNYCGFIHSMPDAPLRYNSNGLPIRLDEPACSFYMHNHWCGYGAGCKFHHPELNYYVPQDYGEAQEYHDGWTGSTDGGYYPISVANSPQLP